MPRLDLLEQPLDVRLLRFGSSRESRFHVLCRALVVPRGDLAARQTRVNEPDIRVLLRIGRQALFVVNLETKIMAGERSEGMLLDIGYDDDIAPVLAVPETPVPDGIRAG